MIIGKRFEQVQRGLDRLIAELAARRTRQTCVKLLKAKEFFGDALLEIKEECKEKLSEEEWFV